MTILLLGFLLGVGINAHALPLWEDSPIMVDGDTYTIADRQEIGDFNSTYNGYTGAYWSGYYIGTIFGNDRDQKLSDIISYYLGALYPSVDTDKVDVPNGSAAGSLSNGNLTVTWEADRMSGIWSTSGSVPAVYADFYTVKGSNEFALYYLDSTTQDGIWTTAHLLTNRGNQPALSHFSATYTNAAPVPEPSIVLLLGTALFVIICFERKKFRKLLHKSFERV